MSCAIAQLFFVGAELNDVSIYLTQKGLNLYYNAVMEADILELE